MSPPSQSDHESPREVFRAVRAVRVTVARSVDELAMDVLEFIPVWKMGIEDTQESSGDVNMKGKMPLDGVVVFRHSLKSASASPKLVTE